jgi:hypothetical protein
LYFIAADWIRAEEDEEAIGQKPEFGTFFYAAIFCLETSRELLNLNLFKRLIQESAIQWVPWLVVELWFYLSCNQRAMCTMCAIAAMIFSLATREQCGQL